MTKPYYIKTAKGQAKIVWGLPVAVETPEIQVARWAFAYYEEALNKGIEVSRAELFWWMVEQLWGVGAKKKFIRHPWAEKMTEKACEYQYLGISGAGSTGKSDWGAMWGIINWFSDPDKTKVLVTSTTMKDAQKRIWGSIRDYYYGAKERLPGKYVHSFGQIRTSEKALSTLLIQRSEVALTMVL